MTRLEKCELAVSKGFEYDKNTGIIFGVMGKPLKKTKRGYISLTIWNGKNNHLLGHQFAWYLVYNEIVELIDHKNRIKSDNRIINLRKSTKQLNGLNNKAKGCSFAKLYNKWESYLIIGGEKQFLGYYDSEKEAHSMYLLAKKRKIKKLWKLQEIL